MHTSAALKTGLIAQRILKEEGVDLTKVVIGHCVIRPTSTTCARSPTRARCSAIDRFGIDVFLPFEDRVTTVAALAKVGYADRMVLAHDASCYSDFYSESYKTALLPRWNYTHITDDVLPALHEHGSTRPRSRRCWSTTPPATSPEARSEPNGSYRDFPHAQPLPASGCSG